MPILIIVLVPLFGGGGGFYYGRGAGWDTPHYGGGLLSLVLIIPSAFPAPRRLHGPRSAPASVPNARPPFRPGSLGHARSEVHRVRWAVDADRQANHQPPPAHRDARAPRNHRWALPDSSVGRLKHSSVARCRLLGRWNVPQRSRSRSAMVRLRRHRELLDLARTARRPHARRAMPA